MKIRVLTIMSRLEMGGIEKTLLSCLPIFKACGIEMHVLCTLGGSLDREYIKAGATLIDFRGSNKPFFDAVRLKEVLNTNAYDIVHSRYGHTSGLFAKVCKSMGIPILISVHNEKSMFKPNWTSHFLMRRVRQAYLNLHQSWSKKYANKIVGHSEANLKYFTENYSHNTELYTVVYNGVDFSKFEHTTEEINDVNLKTFTKDADKVFIHIGSFKHQKNHRFLLETFANLEPIKNNYKLLLLGTGNLFDDLKSRVEHLGLEKHVYFTGVVSDISKYLNVSDIFFFPSLYEGFGNVLIEAQYAKVSVLASKIAPHYEASYKGYHQYFFDPANIEEAVANAKQSIEDIDLGQHASIRLEAYRFSEQFSIENMAKNLIEMYHQESLKTQL